MDELTQVLGVASNLSGFGWLVVIVYFLYKDGTLSKLIGRVSSDYESTPSWATKLMTYVNHDQTEKIDRILTSVDSLATSVKAFTDTLERKITEPLAKIVLKHEEWEKYGIPTQCIDDNK